jgi:hypothetical protein
MEGLLVAFSTPYIFPHEDGFVLGVGALIAGLLLFRFALARWNRSGDRTER